jgi:hypothetical protein
MKRSRFSPHSRIRAISVTHMGRAGRREEAEKLATAVAPNAFSQAIIFAGLGDKDRTVKSLRKKVGLPE